MDKQPKLSDFPMQTTERLRFSDTDKLGHVNNAVFSTLLESGRVAFLFERGKPILPEGLTFVIASLHLDFLGEMTWPGQVQIGTAVTKLGRSSVTLEQGLFQDRRCVAEAQTVIVQMNETTRKSQPFDDATQSRLAALIPAGSN